MTTAAICQDVWNAAFAVLDGLHPEAHDLATRISDAFETSCRTRQLRRRVPESTRDAIKADLIKGAYSYEQIRRRHGVGMSTVQRIARELRERGVTVHTVGSRNDGRRFPRNAGAPLGRVRTRVATMV